MFYCKDDRDDDYEEEEDYSEEDRRPLRSGMPNIWDPQFILSEMGKKLAKYNAALNDESDSSEGSKGPTKYSKVKSFSEIDNIIKNVAKNDKGTDIDKLSDVVDAIFNISEETVDEVYKKIQDYGHNFIYFTRCVEYALRYRPKQIKSLSSVLSLLSKNVRYIPDKYLRDDQKKVLAEKNTEIVDAFDSEDLNEEMPWDDDSDHMFDEGTIGRAIIDDDIDKFIEMSQNTDFNPKENVWVTKNRDVYYVTDNIESDDYKKEDIEVNWIQIIAFYGAVKCFKYAFKEGKSKKASIKKYAIAGGNKEIIKMLEDNGVKFNGCFEVAVRYHRDELCDWLIKNYTCEDIPLRKAVKYHNIRAVLFICMNKLDNTKNSVNRAFFSATKLSNLEILRYLFKTQNVKIEFKDIYDRTPFYVAAEKENIEVMKFLYTECNAYPRVISSNRTPVQIVAEKGNVEVVKYLVEKMHVDVNHKDSLGQTAFSTALYHGRLECVKYFVEGLHLNIKDRGEHVRKEDVKKYIQERWELYDASKEGNLEKVKELIEKKNFFAGQRYNQETALEVAQKNGRKDVVAYLKTVK